MKILVTGAAGFIGSATAHRLLSRGETVVAVDNLNDYYEVRLKQDRLEQFVGQKNFRFEKIDLSDTLATNALFRRNAFDRVIHLAAQAGVRYSLKNPHAYIDSNIVAFMNILEGCRHAEVQHLVYASSSSVYGSNTQVPFSEQHEVDHPVSLYAATKKSNELMAHAYSHLYRLPTTGLRFFTVYGPWGRPDMAYFLFTKAILEGEKIDVYNFGQMQRDFTYIDDIVEGIIRALDRPATPESEFESSAPKPHVSSAPFRIFNIGNHNPVPLLEFIGTIEDALGTKAKVNLLPIADGDVATTYADVSALNMWTGFAPQTQLRDGIARFVTWYRDYYKV